MRGLDADAPLGYTQVMENKITPDETTRLDPLNEFAFKKIFGEKGDEPQLISFLNAVLQRTGKDSVRDVRIIESREPRPDRADGMPERLDVLAELENGTKVNIKVHRHNEGNMVERSLRDWAWLYRQGVERDGVASPVIQINLLDFILFEDRPGFHHSFRFREDNNKDYVLTDDLEIHFIEMPKFRMLK
jgi:predicted transposase/invertase (TIGR01784 family)